MAKNKIITSQGNVQFINSKGRTINVHPWHVYSVYEGDTVSFLFVYMKDYSGQAIFASQYEDLEVNGVVYDNMEDLKDAISVAFAHAGAQARCEIVTELPDDPYTNTIYLVKKEHGEGYDEYIWNEEEEEWELIGDTDIEFERYLQITDFNVYSAATAEDIAYISGAVDTNAADIVSLSGAIDSVSGAVDSEVARATSAETALDNAIANEASARTAADTTLQNNINSANARIDAEQLARAQADTALSGAVDNLSSVKADKVDAVASAEYVSSSATINFKNINGTVISSIDASDFLIDGMVEDVRIENGYLVIDFNTESGVQDIEIPLTDIFDPSNYYDKSAVDAIVSGINASISAETSARTEAINAVEAEIGSVSDSLSAYSTTVEMNAAIDAATSGKLDTSVFEVYSGAVDTAIAAKADPYVAGENITISGNVISAEAGGIDSGAVESIVEDYMTDPSYVANSAVTCDGEGTALMVGTSGNTRWYRESNNLRLTYNSIGSQGYVVPNRYDSWGQTNKDLYIQGTLKGSSDFFKYLKDVYGINSNQIAGECYPMLALKAEYASAITQAYKGEDYKLWYGFDEIPTLPKPLTEIEGIVKGDGYLCTTYSNVSGSTYLVMNPMGNSSDYYLKNTVIGLGYGNPLDFSGIDFSDDMNRYYISMDGHNSSIGHTIGFYLLLVQVYNGGFIVLPLDNASSQAWSSTYWNNRNYKPLAYTFTMEKEYDGVDMTNLYSKVSSAQSTANSAQTTANSALNIANQAVNSIVQSDWNQNNSGSTTFDYIKNRPMWKEKAYSDKIYESDPIMSFNLDNYELTLDSPLVVGDGVKVGYKSRYDTGTGQTMFTDTVKVNSGNVPQGSYYCGSYDSASSWNSKWMWSNDLTTWYVTNQMFDYEASLFIIKASDVYHKLDSNYIDSDIARVTDIPTSNSGLTNDAGYITSASLPSVTSAVTSGSTAVIESGGVYDQLDGLKLRKISQSDYDALVQGGTADANTLYIISD